MEDFSVTLNRRDLEVIAEALSTLGAAKNAQAENHLGSARIAEAERTLSQFHAEARARGEPEPVGESTSDDVEAGDNPLIHPDNTALKARYAEEREALYAFASDALAVRQKLLGQVSLGDHLK
jgi:hypothetical protein